MKVMRQGPAELSPTVAYRWHSDLTNHYLLRRHLEDILVVFVASIERCEMRFDKARERLNPTNIKSSAILTLFVTPHAII